MQIRTGYTGRDARGRPSGPVSRDLGPQLDLSVRPAGEPVVVAAGAPGELSVAEEKPVKRRLSPEGSARIVAANRARAERQRGARGDGPAAPQPAPDLLVEAYRTVRRLPALLADVPGPAHGAALDLRALLAAAIADRAADAP